MSKLLTEIQAFKISTLITLKPSRVLWYFQFFVHLCAAVLLVILVQRFTLQLVALTLVVVSYIFTYRHYQRMLAINSLKLDDKGTLTVLLNREPYPVSLGEGSLLTGLFVMLHLKPLAVSGNSKRTIYLIVLPDSTSPQEFWQLRQFFVLNAHLFQGK